VLRTRFAIGLLMFFAAAGLAGGQDRKFELGFKKDGKFVPYYQEVSTSVSQVITVQGQNLTQQQKSTFWYKWNPTKDEKKTEGKDEWTQWTVEQTIEGLEMSIDISGNAITYSSKSDAAPGTGNAGLVEFFKGIKDAKFTATLGKNYKVEKVEGKDAFLKQVSAGNAQLEGLLRKVLTEAALAEMIDPTAKLFPDKAVKPGDTWEKKTTLTLGPIGTYDLTYKIKYEKVEKEKDVLSVDTVLSYKAPEDGADGLLFRIKKGSTLTSVNEKDDSKGTVIYDPKAGRIESAEIKVKLKGDLLVTVGNTDTKVELEQTQKTSIKTADASFVTAKPAEKDKK
jgi:hypothetical protein